MKGFLVMAQNKKSEEMASEITYRDKTYALAFNLNVMEEIQNEYGTVEAWGNMVQAENEPKAKDIKYGFMAMLNEGVDIYNEEHAGDDDFEKRPFFTDKQVGRIISEVGILEAAAQIRKTVVDSTKSDEKN